MKLTVEQKRQVVRDEIKKETERWRVAKKYPKAPTKPPKPPTPIQELSAFFSSGPFNCRTENSRKAAELILKAAGVKDYKFPGGKPKKKSTGKCVGAIPSFTAIVPLMEVDDHNYPLGEPVLALNSGWSGMLRMTGTTGNHLNNNKNVSRPATPGEIDAFIERLPEKRLDQIFEFDVIERLLGVAAAVVGPKAPAKKKVAKKKARR
jgi:hypothetical protein